MWRGKGIGADRLRAPDIIKKVDEIELGTDDFGKYYFDQDYQIFEYINNIIQKRNPGDAVPDAFTE